MIMQVKYSSGYLQISSCLTPLRVLCSSYHGFSCTAGENTEVHRDSIICPRLHIISGRAEIQIETVWLPSLCC